MTILVTIARTVFIHRSVLHTHYYTISVLFSIIIVHILLLPVGSPLNCCLHSFELAFQRTHNPNWPHCVPVHNAWTTVLSL